ncbi:hypothetical protein Q73_14475 [Bacillus coahuilensis m2-6]|nr:hypothetical protein Q73_14475 [Bacillus coahuilensis m2-6]
MGLPPFILLYTSLALYPNYVIHILRPVAAQFKNIISIFFIAHPNYILVDPILIIHTTEFNIEGE